MEEMQREAKRQEEIKMAMAVLVMNMRRDPAQIQGSNNPNRVGIYWFIIYSCRLYKKKKLFFLEMKKAIWKIIIYISNWQKFVLFSSKKI